MFGKKAEIAVLEKAVPFELEFAPFSFETFYEPKHPDVLRINPKQQVPVLIDGELEIFDSTQIFEYLEDLVPEPPLWPRNIRTRARARLLELRSDEVFFANVQLQMPRQRAAAGEERAAQAVTAIHSFYDEMERVLTRSEYLAGDFSYADIAFFTAQFFASFLGEPWREGHEHLNDWRARMNARDSVQHVVGKMNGFLQEQGLSVPTI